MCASGNEPFLEMPQTIQWGMYNSTWDDNVAPIDIIAHSNEKKNEMLGTKIEWNLMIKTELHLTSKYIHKWPKRSELTEMRQEQ